MGLGGRGAFPFYGNQGDIIFITFTWWHEKIFLGFPGGLGGLGGGLGLGGMPGLDQDLSGLGKMPQFGDNVLFYI